jgi:hypothetical protein
MKYDLAYMAYDTQTDRRHNWEGFRHTIRGIQHTSCRQVDGVHSFITLDFLRRQAIQAELTQRRLAAWLSSFPWTLILAREDEVVSGASSALGVPS